MSATNAFEAALLSLIFENTSTGLNIGDATGLRGSATAGVLYVSLHTADPTETGSQTSSETSYTNYQREPVNRDSAAWTTSGTTLISNDAAITFDQCGVTGATITHFGIGSNSATAGDLWIKGTASLVVSTGVTPQFAAGALQISLD